MTSKSKTNTHTSQHYFPFKNLRWLPYQMSYQANSFKLDRDLRGWLTYMHKSLINLKSFKTANFNYLRRPYHIQKEMELILQRSDFNFKCRLIVYSHRIVHCCVSQSTCAWCSPAPARSVAWVLLALASLDNQHRR